MKEDLKQRAIQYIDSELDRLAAIEESRQNADLMASQAPNTSSGSTT